MKETTLYTHKTAALQSVFKALVFSQYLEFIVQYYFTCVDASFYSFYSLSATSLINV